MFYSPLRYPGGKGKLAPFMEYMIIQLGHRGGTYIEPFAGGAGIAIELLLNGVVIMTKVFGLFGKQYLLKQIDLSMKSEMFHLRYMNGRDSMKYV